MAFAPVLFPAAPVLAQRSAVSVPATTLDTALRILAQQIGAEIVSTEAGLAAIRTPQLQGSMPAEKALAQLLRGTGFRARAIRGGGYRIVRVLPARGGEPSRPAPARPAAAQPPPPPPAEIVVTASKQRIALLRYPGSLTALPGTPGSPALPAGTLSDAVHQVPILQSTQLGNGRNKVFIRGIADSSFNGSTQSPTSIYLDDVQLNYSGPDPGLRLYDMAAIEVLEGPQGTLYGSGAFGGVIRLTSNPVDLHNVATAATAGMTQTRGGAAGFDAAGMINLPLMRDEAGLRIVGYTVHDGGFLRDIDRGARNVNRANTIGGRIAVRADAGGGWQIDASGVGQRIDARDGNYAERIDGPLTRRTLIAQPFTNRLLFGRLVATKEWDTGLRFVSASGIVGYDTRETFDATARTPSGAIIGHPATYRVNHDKRLLSQEARVSRSLPNGNSWVAGFSLVSDRDILSRTVRVPDRDVSIIGVTNVTNAGSAFAEATIAFTGRFALTGGGRITAARTDGNPSATPRSANFFKGRLARRIDPTLAASWQLGPSLALFARLQSGFRTGGLAVAPGLGRVANYKSDAIQVGEIGFRKLRSGATGIAWSGSVSVARWTDVQADLITRAGQPYTANIGDADIRALESDLDWIPLTGLRLQAAFLLTDNQVRGALADLSRRNNRRLPETPPLAVHTGLSYAWQHSALRPRIGLSGDYTGRSVLGTGDFLDVSQGRFWTADAFAAITWRKLEISVTLDNITDRRANQFAFGNPFSLSARDQITPLRPRNVRVGITTGW
ncbi:TonB-dependent receptor [Sphingomonas sp. WG]|nr:TonB-dependent receptor [Sphingomonas sp. WG]